MEVHLNNRERGVTVCTHSTPLSITAFASQLSNSLNNVTWDRIIRSEHIITTIFWHENM